MLRFKEDPPTAEGVRQASRTTQGTVKAKEAGQKTKTARWVGGLLLITYLSQSHRITHHLIP